MKKVLLSLAVAASLGMSSFGANAAVFSDFTINEASVEGLGGSVVADKINGGYEEKITFDGSGGFATRAYATLPQLFSNDGTHSLVGSTQLGSTYTLYALFDAVGFVVPVTPGITQFVATGGSFSLYVDKNKDTVGTLGATGSDPVTLSNTGDDYKVASATVLETGGGILAGGHGFFDLVWNNFTLTDNGTSNDGQSYFTAPNPFHIRVDVNGDFDSFSVVDTQSITGDVSAVFVPEPASMALLGLGLVGLGLSRRRQSK